VLGALPPALSAEVWIAEGAYRPSETGDTAAYFKVRGNTGYYGGFAGTETAKTQRVPGHPVTITGDLGGGVYAEHLFMNDNLQNRNAAFDGMTLTKARALGGVAPFYYGTAILVFNANSVTITNAVFEDLQAYVTGGALFVDAVSIIITDCDFTAVQAGLDGGAVCAYSDGSVTIEDCDFITTQAGKGGAVYASSSGSFTIRGCDFTGTLSGGSGGAVFASASTGPVTIENCDFEDTESSGSGGSGGGGAVAASSSGGSVSITGCDFEDTQSDLDGGAVSASSSSGSVTIEDCGFENTQSGANGKGGAVYAYSSSGSVTIEDCDFEDARGGTDGGAVYASSASVTITDCEFTGTQAGSSGGAVYAQASTITIPDYTSTGTRAGIDGGSLYMDVEGSASISGDTRITDSQAVNTASDSYVRGGGGMYIITVGLSSTVTLSGVTFDTVAVSGSAASTLGGAVYFRGEYGGINLTMTNCSIAGASSSEKGGAIAGSGASSCTLNGVSFTGCSAPQGSLLYGNALSSAPTIGPAYTVGPGCSVNNTFINASNWMTVLPPNSLYLINGATITFAP
jgi:hypothetical protein